MTIQGYPETNWQGFIEASPESSPDAKHGLSNRDLLKPADHFVKRHIGPRSRDVTQMLETLGVSSLEELVDQAVPKSIRMEGHLNLEPPRSETAVLNELSQLAAQNKLFRSFIGMGYTGTITPPVIQRNILENPGWYTQYTPYQPEISQGRLEALINFQTMIIDLTGLEIANASLLDEGTAAAEAMTLCQRAMPRKSKATTFFVSELCHPQTIAVVQTRAKPLGINVVVGNHITYDFAEETFGVLLQYPTTEGDILDYGPFAEKAHEQGALVVVAADILSLIMLRPPGEFGADVAVGNTQQFGVPMGFGGPHAAYMATMEKYQRVMPGRLIGVSIDSNGNPAYRLALQTREQHIRRDKATSNICTAQVLLAIMASMYAVYHGPEGLRRIARRVRLMTGMLAAGIRKAGYSINDAPVFDTLKISGGPRNQATIQNEAQSKEINLRYYDDGAIGITLDEATTVAELEVLFGILGVDENVEDLADQINLAYDGLHQRQSQFLTHPVFNSYHSETKMMRYITWLQNRDLSLTHSMIPLGSCTMKLNAAAEMMSITLPEFGQMHPFAPMDQTEGYRELFRRLETWLAEITGFAAVSLQPNSGASGEYAGMLVIREYHKSRGDDHRHICLIPSSAHGTNPASAVMAGMKVVVVKCDENGNVDVEDLKAKAAEHKDDLAALMITYPSTHGVYEESIQEICTIIHNHGGQVYFDGANMNALVGLSRPGHDLGADVCHLNLHKTFAIPHGGGGPGVGPIGVAAHLVPFLPNSSIVDGVGGEQSLGAVSSGPWGSAGVTPISYAYIAMMGDWGLTVATQMAILNANYIAQRLEPYFPVLYRGAQGRVAHECIIELRHLKEFVTVDDVAKRLMDFGFHAPTMSFPVPGTLMIEPTESESLEELNRFCEAMIAIRGEIQDVQDGKIAHEDSPLAHAPHTAGVVTGEDWDRQYTREQAAFPSAFTHKFKFWPYVGRIDNVYGDRNLFCVCVPVEEYTE